MRDVELEEVEVVQYVIDTDVAREDERKKGEGDEVAGHGYIGRVPASERTGHCDGSEQYGAILFTQSMTMTQPATRPVAMRLVSRRRVN